MSVIKDFCLSCYLGGLYACEIKWSKLHRLPLPTEFLLDLLLMYDPLQESPELLLEFQTEINILTLQSRLKKTGFYF